MRKPRAILTGLVISLALSAPSRIYAQTRPAHGHKTSSAYAERWNGPIPVGHPYLSPAERGRHGSRTYERVYRWRPYPEPSATMIDKSIRSGLVTSTEKTMDGFGCLYDPLSATDYPCAPR